MAAFAKHFHGVSPPCPKVGEKPENLERSYVALRVQQRCAERAAWGGKRAAGQCRLRLAD